MEQALFTCDKCSTTSVSQKYHTPQDWEKISFSVQYQSVTNDYHLCHACAKELKIRTQAKPEIKKQDIADRLLEIITEIVGMNQ